MAQAAMRAIPLLDLADRIQFMDEKEINKLLSDLDAGSILESVKIRGIKTASGTTIEEIEIDAENERDVDVAKAILNDATIVQTTQVPQTSQQQPPTEPPSATENRFLIKDVIDEYVAEKMLAQSWREKVKDEYMQSFNLLMRMLDDKQYVDQVDRHVARYVKQTLLKLPKRLNKKKYMDMSIEEIIDYYDEDETISISTVNKHLERFSGLFDWMSVNAYRNDNCFSSMTIKHDGSIRNQRDPYTIDELNELFAYMQKHEKTISTSLFYATRISLYSALRLSEIAFLRIKDIQNVDGYRAFVIEDKEIKKLKTKNAERLIPIHSKLYDTGLFEYVKARQEESENEEELLFKDLSLAQDPAHALSSRFTYLRKKMGWKETKPKINFHSFRHTFITALQHADVDENKIAATAGHAVGRTESFQRYGKGYLIEQIYKVVELVKFDVKNF